MSNLLIKFTCSKFEILVTIKNFKCDKNGLNYSYACSGKQQPGTNINGH